MLPRFNLFVEWFCRWILSKITVSQRLLQTANSLTGRGTVFYVTRDRSYLDAIAFNYLLRENGMPLVPFVGNLRLQRFGPVLLQLALMRDWFLRLIRVAPGRPSYRERLLSTIRQRYNGMIFLKRGDSILKDFWEGNDPFEILVEEARHSDRPIYLLPSFLILDVHPDRTRPSIPSRMLGTGEEPSLFRRYLMLLRGFRRGRLEVGDKIHLQDFIAAHPGMPTRQVVRRLKLALLQEFAEERRVFAGPKILDRLDLKSEILRNPQLVEFMENYAKREELTREQVLKRAEKILDKMASDVHLDTALFVDRMIWFGFNRTYEGVFVDEEGLENVKRALKQGPVVLIPNHSSHADYLLVSSVFYHRHVQLPHIAAGENLAFWPLGAIFRRSGAFFIRRSFRQDKLYSQIFDTYMAYLLREKFAIEFFIEGTRSRNGKLRPPQFGMLSFLVGSFASGASEKLTFIPVGVDYDRIFEENAYRKELEGASKEKESLLGLLKLPRMLKSRRGNIYLNFGKPIDLVEYCNKHGFTLDKPASRREAVRRLGVDIIDGIQAARTTTGSSIIAAGLLAGPHRPKTFEQLVDSAGLFREIALERGIRLGEGFGEKASEAERESALRDNLSRFLEAQIVTIVQHRGEEAYMVSPGQYLVLDYYRNGLVNPYAPFSMTAHLVQRAPIADEEGINLSAIDGQLEFLRSLLDKEIMSRPIPFVDAEKTLLSAGLLTNGAGPVQITDAARLDTLAWVTRPLLQAYLAIVTGLRRVSDSEPLPKAELLKRLREHAVSLYANGRISCRELLTTQVFDRAAEALGERGVLERQESGERKGPYFRVKSAEQLAELAERIDGLV